MILNSDYATSLRDSGSTATFDLETGGLDIDGNNSICVVTARSFTAINTIYNINDSCNTFQIGWYDSVTGFKITTITITNGAYDIYTITTAMKTSLQAAYDAGGNIALFTPTYTELTGKVSFTATFSSVATTLVGFYIITNSYSALVEKLGFDLTKIALLVTSGSYYGFSSLITSSLTGTNLPNLYYPRMLYICIDQIRTPNRVSLPNNEYGIVLTEFVVTSSFGDLIHKEPNNDFEYHIPNLKTDTFTVRIIDEFGKPLDWNGGSWILVLGLQYGTHSINEDPTLGRTFRPMLHKTVHDPLQTSHERASSKRKYF